MIENKRFSKVMGFIQDNTCEGGDVEGVMDLTEIENMLNRLNDENMQLKSENQRVSEQKCIYKQDWKHLCIDKELLDSENEQLRELMKDLKMENNSLKLLVQNWEAFDEEKDEQLDKQNQALKKFHDKNEHIKKIIQNYNTNEYKHSSDALTDIIDILEK